MKNRKFQVVLIEDNEADVYLFQHALESAGLNIELTAIGDGEEALAFAHGLSPFNSRPKPDLTVLDLNLPKHAGVEVLEALRSTTNRSDIPVVIMSSSAAPADQVKVHELGVSCFITKPLDLDEFLQIGEVIKALLFEKKDSEQAG